MVRPVFSFRANQLIAVRFGGTLRPVSLRLSKHYQRAQLPNIIALRHTAFIEQAQPLPIRRIVQAQYQTVLSWWKVRVQANRVMVLDQFPLDPGRGGPEAVCRLAIALAPDLPVRAHEVNEYRKILLHLGQRLPGQIQANKLPRSKRSAIPTGSRQQCFAAKVSPLRLR